MKRALDWIAAITLGLGLATAAAVSPAHGPSASAEVPSRFASRTSAMGITYSELSPVDGRSRSAALHAVSDDFSAVVGHGHSRGIVVSVTFTDTGYGRPAGGSNGPTRQPVYVDRPAIMVIHPNTPVALSGPAGSPGGTINSTLVSFVDPNSFRVLRAVSFATDTHVVRPGG